MSVIKNLILAASLIAVSSGAANAKYLSNHCFASSAGIDCTAGTRALDPNQGKAAPITTPGVASLPNAGEVKAVVKK